MNATTDKPDGLGTLRACAEIEAAGLEGVPLRVVSNGNTGWPVIGGAESAEVGPAWLSFRNWEERAEVVDALKSTILEDLEHERLCAGEVAHLRWLLDRASRHGQVEIAEGATVSVNAVESVVVRLGCVVVTLRAGADEGSRGGAEIAEAGADEEGSHRDAEGTEARVIGLDLALARAGVSRGLVLPDVEVVDDLAGVWDAQTRRDLSWLGPLAAAGVLIGWLCWLIRL